MGTKYHVVAVSVLMSGILLLGGCAIIPGAANITQKAQTAVDLALASNESAICQGHFPMRAYIKRYGNRWPALVQFCGWGVAPPVVTLPKGVSDNG